MNDNLKAEVKALKKAKEEKLEAEKLKKEKKKLTDELDDSLSGKAKKLVSSLFEAIGKL